MNDNPSPLEIHPDEHLEARITAYVLGQASPFEAAEIEELISKSPELRLFANRTRTLNELVKEAETTANSPDAEWKLSGERRIALAPVLGAGPVLLPNNEKRIRRASYRAAFGIAACFVVTVFVKRLLFVSPTIVQESPTIVSYRYMAALESDEKGEAGNDGTTNGIQAKMKLANKSLREEKSEVAAQRQPSAPSSSINNAIAANTISPSAIPVPDLEVAKLGEDFGDGDDFGGGWRDNSGGGGGNDESLAMNGGRSRGEPGKGGAADNFAAPAAAASVGDGWKDTEISGKVTSGLRSGDAAVSRDSIDAILNNPDRTAQTGKPQGGSEILPDALKESFLGIESLAFSRRIETLDEGEKSKNAPSARPSQDAPADANGDPFAEPSPISELAQREIIRRQNTITEADKQLIEGREAYEKGDYTQAKDKFDNALAKLPESPATEDRRDAIVDHLGKASVAAAQQMRKVGKYDEAREVLEKAAAAGGENQDEIKAELGYLDDPIRTNPALTYKHTKDVDDVRRKLYMAQGNFDLGKYDDAKKAYEDTLRIDPYNSAARRGMEKIAAAKSDYYRAAYDHTRAELLMDVDKAWELSVPAEVDAKGKELAEDGKSAPSAEPEKKRAEDFVSDAVAGNLVEKNLPGVNGKQRYAWWVEDEGKKAETQDLKAWLSSSSDGQLSDVRQGGFKSDLSQVQETESLDMGNLFSGNVTGFTGAYDTFQAPPAPPADFEPANSVITLEVEPKIADFEGFVDYGAPIAGDPKQVKIKTKFTEVTQANNKELGFDWIVRPFGSVEGNAKTSDMDIKREVPLMPNFFSGGEDASVATRSGAASNIEAVREFTYPTEYEAPETANPAADPFFDTSDVTKRDGGIEYEIHSGYKSEYLFRGVDLANGEKTLEDTVRDAVTPAFPTPIESDADLAPVLGDIPLVGRLLEQKPIDLADLSQEIPAAQEPFSTFSLNISDASFQVASSAVAKGERPDPESIKPEQFYNAVSYDDPAPSTGEPVAAAIGQVAHPVIPGRNLVRMSVRTASTGRAATQPLVLTLLVDQSGSMARGDRRKAMDKALTQLATLMQPDDRITVIGFSRTPRLLADSISGDEAAKLPDIINQSSSEGGTNLEQALALAESLALRHKLGGAQNRIVLFTDGAANLGNADPERLAERVKTLRQQDLAFDIAGIGTDDINDRLLSELARHGNGRYYLVGENTGDSLAKQLAGAFRPAAENVKIQVKFNPQRVGNYKLIGFEKDRLKTEDFRNDSVDAAELAADEAGTAIYQVEPLPDGSGEIGELFVRFRDTATGEMVERSWTIPYETQAPAIDKAQPPMQLAALSMLAAQKLQTGPLADAINFRDLAPTIAAVKQAYARSPEAQQMITLINALR